MPGTRVIIEIQETDLPLQQANSSYSLMCIYFDNPLARFIQVVTLNGAPMEVDADGIHELHRFRVKLGHSRFSWPVRFYTERFGAVRLDEIHSLTANAQVPRNAGRAFLRPGHVERPLILEILGTTPRKEEDNPSQEMIVMYTYDFHGFIEKITAAPEENAGRLLNTYQNGDQLIGHIRDLIGYFWMIKLFNQLPAEVINAYNLE